MKGDDRLRGICKNSTKLEMGMRWWMGMIDLEEFAKILLSWWTWALSEREGDALVGGDD